MDFETTLWERRRYGFWQARLTAPELCIIGYNLLLVLLVASSGRYYVDDLRRAIDGHGAWTADGRPLASLLAILLSGDRHIVDSFPMPQLLAGLSLAALEIGFCRRFMTAAPGLGAIFALFISANPFLLQNLSYHFDCISMCLAMLFAAAPFLGRARMSRLWLGALSVLAALLSFQAAISIFLMFWAAEAAMLLVGNAPGGEILARSLRRGLQLGAPGVLFFLFFHLLVSPDSYSAAHGQMDFSGDGPDNALTNLRAFWTAIHAGIAGGMFIALKLALCMLYVGAAVGCLAARSRLSRKLAAAALLLLLPVLAVAPMCVLKNPIYMARVYVAAGFVPALAAAFILQGEWRVPRIAPAVIGILALFFAVQVAAVYADAARSQSEYESAIFDRMANDIFAATQLHAITGMVFHGSRPLDAVARNDAVALPLINQLVFTYLEDWSWNPYLMLAHRDIALPKAMGAADICRSAWVASAQYYDLRLDGGTLIVDFSKAAGCSGMGAQAPAQHAHGMP